MATSKQPKSQTLLLDHTAVEADFFEDLRMLCLICPHEPYHVAWHINGTLPFNFKRSPNQDIFMGNDYYVVYEYEEPITQIQHYLVASRSKTNYILPELKNIDFIWMIKGSHKVEEYVKTLPLMVKNIPVVVDCRHIDHKKLSNRKVFLL
jgi:hypothetical protein